MHLDIKFAQKQQGWNRIHIRPPLCVYLIRLYSISIPRESQIFFAFSLVSAQAAR